MKKWTLFLLAAVLIPLSAGADVVNNSGSLAADSISIPFTVLDSAGNMTTLASGDSVCLVVFYPSGAVAFSDSMAYNDANITSQAVSDYTFYSLKYAVADIDGTPRDGLYSFGIVVNDQTSAALATPQTGYFNLVQSFDYDTWAETVLSEIQDALDTLQSQDGWVAQQASVTILRDSIDALLDTVANLHLWVSQLTSSDNIGINLDDITGTLDSNELGPEFLNVTKFSANTITAAIIAAAAITASEAPNLDAAVSSRSAFDATTDTVLIKDAQIADIAQQASDSTLVDSIHYQGSASGLTAAEIVDSIFGADTASNNGGAGTYGQILADPSYVQGSASGLDSNVVQRILNRSTRDTLGVIHGSGSWATAVGFSTHSAADVYTQFTSGSNEDAFKATGFSTHSAADVWAVGTRALTDKIGFGLSTAERGAIEDSVHANAADYKADVSGVSTFDPTTDTVLIKDAQIGDIAGQAADSVALPDSIPIPNAQVGAIAQAASDSTQADSSSYQGSGSNAEAIADAVWDESQAAHVTSGSFGKYLDTEVSGISGLSGTGAYSYTIMVVDTTGADSALAHTTVFVNNQAQNLAGGPYQVTTDENGSSTFNLDAGTFVRFITEPGYGTVVDTFTVSAAATDTLIVYQDNGGRTTLAWYLKKGDEQPWANAEVTLDLIAVNDSMLYIGDSTIASDGRRQITATANSDGLLDVDLWPNSLFTNDSSYYRIIAKDSQGRRIIDWFSCRVPESDTTVWVNKIERWKD